MADDDDGCVALLETYGRLLADEAGRLIAANTVDEPVGLVFGPGVLATPEGRDMLRALGHTDPLPIHGTVTMITERATMDRLLGEPKARELDSRVDSPPGIRMLPVICHTSSRSELAEFPYVVDPSVAPEVADAGFRVRRGSGSIDA